MNKKPRAPKRMRALTYKQRVVLQNIDDAGWSWSGKYNARTLTNLAHRGFIRQHPSGQCLVSATSVGSLYNRTHPLNRARA